MISCIEPTPFGVNQSETIVSDDYIGWGAAMDPWSNRS